MRCQLLLMASLPASSECMTSSTSIHIGNADLEPSGYWWDMTFRIRRVASEALALVLLGRLAFRSDVIRIRSEIRDDALRVDVEDEDLLPVEPFEVTSAEGDDGNLAIHPARH